MDSSMPSLSLTISLNFLRFMSTESVVLSNHLFLCHPLLLLPSIFPIIRVFSSDSAFCFRWPKYWSFSFSFSPSSEHSGLISLRIHWFYLLKVWGTLKTLLQRHSSKASVLWHSAFLMDQFWHPYMITGKTIVLSIWTFSGKVMSLLFNMLSRFITAFLPQSKCLLISWLQSPSTVDFGAQENKICHHFHHFVMTYVYRNKQLLCSHFDLPLGYSKWPWFIRSIDLISLISVFLVTGLKHIWIDT